MHVFLKTILQEQKSPFSSYIIYHYFYPVIFMFEIYLLSSSLFESQCFLHTSIEKLILVPGFLVTNRFNLESKG